MRRGTLDRTYLMLLLQGRRQAPPVANCDLVRRRRQAYQDAERKARKSPCYFPAIYLAPDKHVGACDPAGRAAALARKRQCHQENHQENHLRRLPAPPTPRRDRNQDLPRPSQNLLRLSQDLLRPSQDLPRRCQVNIIQLLFFAGHQAPSVAGPPAHS